MSKCIGCGVILQNQDEKKGGYTRDLSSGLCERCFRLRHYGEYQKTDYTNVEYKKILDAIPEENLVLYVTDILSMEMDYIEKFSRVLLVVTKRDIMPKSIKDQKIVEYLTTRFSNVIGVVVVSSLKNYQMDKLYQEILKYSNGKKVYLVGNTNSGKSTLLNQMIHDYGEGKEEVTVSMYPSTTLDQIEISIQDLVFVDTPGLIGEKNIVHYLKKEDLKKITPKKEIKPKSCQVKGRGSLLIGDYVRMDYDTTTANSFVIYTSNLVPVRFCSYEKNTYRDLVPHQYSLSKNQDIVIPGLGFIKFVGAIDVILYLPERVEGLVRDNLI